MIAQSVEYLNHSDPCRACLENRRTDRRERLTAWAASASFLLGGFAVVLLEGALPLAVAVGSACSAISVVLTLRLQSRLEARRLRACGGCR